MESSQGTMLGQSFKDKTMWMPTIESDDSMLSDFDERPRMSTIKKDDTGVYIHEETEDNTVNVQLREALDVFIQDEHTQEIVMNSMMVNVALHKRFHVHFQDSPIAQRSTKPKLMKFSESPQATMKSKEQRKIEQRAEVIKDLKDRDKNNVMRTIIHKCSLDQNLKILKMLFENLKNHSEPGEYMENVREITRMQDLYGNNALALACIYNLEKGENVKTKCIRFLLKCQSDPNVRNKETGFTPLHWAARYSETKIVKMLCMAGAVAYLPDQNGYSPLDYAGKFGSDEVKLFLIEKLYALAKDKMNEYRSIKVGSKVAQLLDTIELPLNANKRASSDPSSIAEESNTIFKKEEFLVSPIFRSSIVYWSCTLSEKDMPWHVLKDMIDELDAYPECPMRIDKDRTALHICAMNGQHLKLKVLVQNLISRYMSKAARGQSGARNGLTELLQNQIVDIYNSIDSVNPRNMFMPASAETKFWKVLKEYQMKRYTKSIKDFAKYLDQLQDKAKNMEFSVDFLDQDGLTPLHYSCQHKSIKCVEIFLFQIGSSIDLSCEAGFRPREMIQYKEVKQIFQTFYVKIDQAMNEKALLREASYSVKKLMLSIQQKQYEDHNISKYMDLDQEQEEPDETQERLSNRICYKNLINFYAYKYPEPITQTLNRILENRSYLPEISILAMLIDINTTVKRIKVNQMIQTLIQTGFIVRMFESVDVQKDTGQAGSSLGKLVSWVSEKINGPPKNLHYLVLELSQDDLEKQATLLEFPIKILEMNLKFKYNKALKHLYEPFRSKDVQEIYREVINRVVNINELQRKKILLKLFKIHDMNQISDVDQKFEETTVLDILKLNFIDHKYQEFHGVSAIKNYLGERWGFTYAFSQFYTAWLVIPATLGLVCTLYQWVAKDHITLWSFAYAICMSFWITIFQERWKRKENQLKLSWGTALMKQKEEIRTEFLGNEEFSHDNNIVNRKDVKKQGVFFQVLNLLIIMLFLSICVISFFLTKTMAGQYAGALNATIIGTTNFLYRLSIGRMMTLENHKYEYKYNEAYISKIFVFQFINANISIIVMIYQANQDDLEALNLLLIQQVTIKTFSLMGSRIISKWGMYQLQKFLYFRKCQAQAQRQASQMQARLNPKFFKQEELRRFQEQQEERKTFEIFSHLRQESTKNYEYKRLITVFKKQTNNNSTFSCIEEEPFLVDQVELNSKLYDRSMEIELCDLSETFILLSYASLYSFICPILPFIIFLNNVFTMKWERKIHLNYFTRKPILAQNGMGAWVIVLEALGYATIMFNSMFLFWFREKLADKVRDMYHIVDFLLPDKGDGVLSISLNNPAIVDALKKKAAFDKEMLEFLIFLIMLEHSVVLIKYIMGHEIGDTPLWVQKNLKKVNHDHDLLALKHKELEKERAIELLEEQVVQQKEMFANLIMTVSKKHQKLIDKYDPLVEEFENNDDELSELKQKYAKLQELKQQPSTAKPKKAGHNASPRGQIKVSGLASFFQARFGALPKMSLLEFQHNLSIQLQKRLFRQTFYEFERIIISKRLVNLSTCHNRVTISCVECCLDFAEVQCHGCDDDSFCMKCFNALHYDHENLSKHHRTYYKQFILDGIEPTPDTCGTHAPTKSHQRWRKFENFNFPLPESNDLFEHLRIYFQHMKQNFLQANNISPDLQQTDLVKMILDQSYGLVGSNYKTQMLNTFQRELKSNSKDGINDFEIYSQEGEEGLARWRIHRQTGKVEFNSGNMMVECRKLFNDEELIYLNRVSLMLLNEKGAKFQFIDFINALNLLQNGRFDQKIDLLLKLVTEGRQESYVISVDFLASFLLMSMPQDICQEINAEKELLLLFDKGQGLPKDKIFSQHLTISEARDLLMNCKGPSMQILECILQTCSQTTQK